MSFKIHNQKNGKLNDQDRLVISQLCIKAGYLVRISKERPEGKQNAEYTHFVEIFEDGEYPTK